MGTDEEDDIRLSVGVLDRVEAWLAGLIKGNQLPIQCCPGGKGFMDSGEDRREFLGKVFAVSRKQVQAPYISNRLPAVSV
jgi:hypothetical protein